MKISKTISLSAELCKKLDTLKGRTNRIVELMMWSYFESAESDEVYRKDIEEILENTTQY